MTGDQIVTDTVDVVADAGTGTVPSGSGDVAPEARERGQHRRDGERRSGQADATPSNDRPRPDMGWLANAIASTIELPRRAAAEAEARMEQQRQRARRAAKLLGLGGVFVVLVLCLTLAALLLGGLPSAASPSTSCDSAVDGVPVNLGAPGQLGGLAGTGITPDEYAAVKKSRYASPKITPGAYVSTSYGPPWGGIQGEGNQTAGGLQLSKGAPAKYFIAVDPKLIGHATWVYIWPNPFEWRGPFLSADTGGAIDDRRIDFYDWRGRTAQYGWGRRTVQVSATPLVATGGAAAATPAPAPSPSASGVGGSDPAVATASLCATGGSFGAPGWGTAGGEAVLADGADRKDKKTEPVLVDYIRAMSAAAGRKIIITTGTNHSKYTTSGNVSDHWEGFAADIGSVANKFENGGAEGTHIAAAALIVAGVPAETATRIAAAGGVHNFCATAPDGRVWRVQMLWKTYKGGNHYNHVHVGLKLGCSHKGVVTS
jgi:3D (Asp-Asp-Asp) domain-containing protein